MQMHLTQPHANLRTVLELCQVGFGSSASYEELYGYGACYPRSYGFYRVLIYVSLSGINARASGEQRKFQCLCYGKRSTLGCVCVNPAGAGCRNSSSSVGLRLQAKGRSFSDYGAALLPGTNVQLWAFALQSAFHMVLLLFLLVKVLTIISFQQGNSVVFREISTLCPWARCPSCSKAVLLSPGLHWHPADGSAVKRCW